MPTPRNHVAGYVDGAVACVAGGRTPDTSAAIDCFDPATSTWAHRATLPAGTSGAAAAVIDGVTIVAGGEPANETHLVDRVQMLTRDGVDGHPDARAASRPRVRSVPRTAVGVRRCDRARLPRRRDLHVDRAVVSPASGSARLRGETP